MERYYGITKTISGTEFRVELWDEPSGLSVNQYIARVEADGGVVEGSECLNQAIGGKTLPMASQGFTIDYEGEGNVLWENPIMNSRVQAQFIVSDTDDHTFFRSLAVENEGTPAIIIYKNSVLHYVGRIIPDGMQYERRPEKNTTYTVTAVDGLALLDRFYVQSEWFGSTSGPLRLSITNLIRQSLALTQIPAYYNHLGEASHYLMDASEHIPTGTLHRLDFFEINMSSVITDLTDFMEQSLPDNRSPLFVDCKTAIERVLRMCSSRLIYTNRYFWIYNGIDAATRNQIYSAEYGTDGTYTNKISTLPQYPIGTNTRPAFEAFPIFTHQPAVRSIKQTFTRMAFNRLVKPIANTGAMTLTTPSVGYVASEQRKVIAKAVVRCPVPSRPTTNMPRQAYILLNFRIYIDEGGGTYKHYNYISQTWDSGKTSIPFYEQVRLDISQVNSLNPHQDELIADFERTFIPPASGDEITLDIDLGNITWNFQTQTVQNQQSFRGVLYFMETDHRPITAPNSNPENAAATEEFEYDTIYGYEFTGNTIKGVGTIWNSDTNSGSELTAQVWADYQLKNYIYAPKLAQVTLIDDGDYYPILVPNFDEEKYIFNGGTFNAQSEQWDMELLQIQIEDVETIDSEDFTDETGDGQQNDAISRAISQVNLLRDSVSNFDESLPTDIMRLSPDTPTTQPTIDTYFNPVVVYDATEDTLEWNVQEMGKVQSLTGGTHNLDVSAELIVCDTTAENVIVTLPSASLVKGRKYIFKKISSSHNVQLSGTIDSAPSYSFNSLWESVTIMSDGSEYYAVGRYHS